MKFVNGGCYSREQLIECLFTFTEFRVNFIQVNRTEICTKIKEQKYFSRNRYKYLERSAYYRWNVQTRLKIFTVPGRKQNSCCLLFHVSRFNNFSSYARTRRLEVHAAEIATTCHGSRVPSLVDDFQLVARVPAVSERDGDGCWFVSCRK